jgi:hypothetical protein
MTEAEAETESERIAQIEAETEAAAQAENDALLVRLSPYILMGAILVLFLLSPLLTIWLGTSPFGETTTRLTAWLWIEIPVVVYAATVVRRGRFKLRDGRVYEGWRVRAGAALAVLVSLAFFWVRMWGLG